MMKKELKKKTSRGLQGQNGTNPESNLCIQCCYISYIACMIRGLDCCLKVVYKRIAGFTSWKDDRKQKTKKKETKNRIIAMIKAKTGIAVDMPDALGAGGTSQQELYCL